MSLINTLNENEIKIIRKSILIPELSQSTAVLNFGPESKINLRIKSGYYTKEDIENEYSSEFIIANKQYKQLNDILKKCIKNFNKLQFVDLFNEGIAYNSFEYRKEKLNNIMEVRSKFRFISFKELLGSNIESNNIDYWTESKIGNYIVDGSIEFTGKDKYLDTIMHEFNENIKFVGVRSASKSIELIFRGKAYMSLCFNNTVVVKKFSENNHNMEEFALNEKASDTIMKHLHNNFTLREIARQDILVQNFIAKKFYELNLSFEKNK